MNERNDRQSAWYTGGWLSPVLVVLFTIFWCLAIYWLIGSRPRDWQFGTAPYIPADSAFSSKRAPSGPVPPQVELPVSATGDRNATR